jgi:hypothetical protein
MDTVKDLIEWLKKLPEDRRIVTFDTEALCERCAYDTRMMNIVISYDGDVREY